MECLISKRKSTGDINYNFDFTPKEFSDLKIDIRNEMEEKGIELSPSEYADATQAVLDILWAYGIVVE